MNLPLSIRIQYECITSSVLNYIGNDFRRMAVKHFLSSADRRLLAYEPADTRKFEKIIGTEVYICEGDYEQGDPYFQVTDKFLILSRHQSSAIDRKQRLRYLLDEYYNIHGAYLVDGGQSSTIRAACNNIKGSLITPIPKTYYNTMQQIVRNLGSIYLVINPKHDGVPCWLYSDNNISTTLILPVKNKTLEFKCIGIIGPNLSNKPIMIFGELVDNTIIVKDIHLKEELEYKDRYEKLMQITTEYKMFEADYLFHYTIQLTTNNVLDNHLVKQKVLKGLRSIDYYMTLSGHTDGVVVYTPDNSNPIKAKPITKYTVDILFDRSSYDINRMGWVTKIPQFKALPPPIDLPSNRCVYEIDITSHNIIRPRIDRKVGNPDSIIQDVLRLYAMDRKFGTVEIWNKSCILYYILLNRLFKTYIYSKYLPTSCKILDLGSGNGGDYDLWRAGKHKVLAVEKDDTRFAALSKTVGVGNIDVILSHTDMLTVFDHLDKHTYHYNYVTMMRSVTNNDINYIEKIFKACRNASVHRIVIVTMGDIIYPGDVKCVCNGLSHGSFTVKISDNNVSVEYAYDDKKESYTDTKLKLDDWQRLANSISAKMTIYRQKDFAKKLGTRKDFAFICNSDIALIFDL